MILGTIAAICLVFVILGVLFGALVFGLASIGTLITIGFEIGMYLLPFILLYLIAKWIWKMTTDKKTDKTE